MTIKTLATAVALVLALGLTGCGKKPNAVVCTTSASTITCAPTSTPDPAEASREASVGAAINGA